MLSNYIFLALCLVWHPTRCAAVNCPYTEITFAKTQGECVDYEGGSISHSTPMTKDPYHINYFADTFLPFCTAKICGDGRHHTFCTTTGSAEGDCIPGDGTVNFAKLYAGKVNGVAIKFNKLAVVPELVKEVVHDFTTKDRSIMLHEHGGHKGASLELKSKRGECVNLPAEWQLRVSSYGSKYQARFYTGENCTGHSVVACRDFTKSGFWEDANNLWGVLCSSERMNDNTRSYKFE